MNGRTSSHHHFSDSSGLTSRSVSFSPVEHSGSPTGVLRLSHVTTEPITEVGSLLGQTLSAVSDPHGPRTQERSIERPRPLPEKKRSTWHSMQESPPPYRFELWGTAFPLKQSLGKPCFDLSLNTVTPLC
jgi:hypothetical protein